MCEYLNNVFNVEASSDSDDVNEFTYKYTLYTMQYNTKCNLIKLQAKVNSKKII